MPRKRQSIGLYRQYTEEKRGILNSWKTVCNGSFAAAARVLSVPATTINTWVTYPNMKVIGSGRKTILDPVIEKSLCDCIDLLSDSGLPCDRSDIQDLAADMVRHLDLTTPFKNDRPGYDWLMGFENRRNRSFSKRAREGLSYQRYKGLSKHNVNSFFDKLQHLEDKYHFKPENI